MQTIDLKKLAAAIRARRHHGSWDWDAELTDDEADFVDAISDLVDLVLENAKVDDKT